MRRIYRIWPKCSRGSAFLRAKQRDDRTDTHQLNRLQPLIRLMSNRFTGRQVLSPPIPDRTPQSERQSELPMVAWNPCRASPGMRIHKRKKPVLAGTGFLVGLAIPLSVRRWRSTDTTRFSVAARAR